MTDSNWNRYERIMRAHADEKSRSVAGLLAGSSRRVRVAHDDGDGDTQAVRKVTAGVVAPTLLAFSLWLLDRARTLGLQRLYFLSRDGQILLDVTRCLADKLNIDIELRYLYSSRRCWVTACITEITREQIEWAFENTLFLSVRSQLERLTLDPGDVESALARQGFPPDAWERNLSASERQMLQSIILEDENVVAALHRAIAESRGLLLDYLRQEGMCDHSKWALVDLGWYATTEKALWRLVNERSKSECKHGIDEVYGFYFGLRGTPPSRRRGLQGEGFFVNEWREDERLAKDLPQLGAIMEAICSADHGTLLHFERGQDSIMPVLRGATMPSLEKWGLKSLRDTIREVIAACPLEFDDLAAGVTLRPMIHDLLASFWFEPTLDEAKGWGRFPLGDKMGHPGGDVRLAKPFRLTSLATAWRNGTIELPYGCTWYWGCHALTPRPVMLCLCAAKRFGRFVHGSSSSCDDDGMTADNDDRRRMPQEQQ